MLCFRGTANWISSAHIHFSQLLFPCRSFQNTEWSSLWATVGPCWLPSSFKQAPPSSAWKFWISWAFSWLLYLFTFLCTSCSPCAMCFSSGACATHILTVWFRTQGWETERVRSFLQDGEQGHQFQGLDQSWSPRERNSQRMWWGVSRQRKTLLGSETGRAEEGKVGPGSLALGTPTEWGTLSEGGFGSLVGMGMAKAIPNRPNRPRSADCSWIIKGHSSWGSGDPSQWGIWSWCVVVVV